MPKSSTNRSEKKYSTVQRLRSLFKKVKKIALVIHPNPDGDAMGSALGFYHILKENSLAPAVIAPNAFPDFLFFLPDARKVILADREPQKAYKIICDADLVVVMDFNAYGRSENLEKALRDCKSPFLLIDHHRQAEIDAAYWWWDVRACSTCELVYTLTKNLFPRYRFSEKSAKCLYTGTMTDTGSFRFPSVKPETHAMIRELMLSGIRHHEIHEYVYDNYSLNRLLLMAGALSKIKIAHEGKSASIFLSQEELNRFGYKKGDTEGFVNLPLSVKGVKLSGFFMETENYIKISLRSKGNVDVNAMARKHFNGGGHKNAAGGKWFGSVDELIQTFEKVAL